VSHAAAAPGDTIRVDAHHHLWPEPTQAEYPWMTDELAAIRRPFTPDDLAPLLAAAGIRATVLVQTRSSVAETETLLAAAVAHPFIAGVVGWVDLTDPGIADAIARLRSLPGGNRLVGIRHQVQDEPDPAWLRRADVRRGIAAVAAAGLAYDLLVRTRELPAAVDTAQALPQVRFVLDHLAKPPIAADGDALAAWAHALRLLAARPNVAAKLSGLVTEADWTSWTVEDLAGPIRVALEAFGPERLLFGSDWPVCLVAASYQRVVDAVIAALDRAGLTRVDRDGVLGANAIDAYRLRVA
jgi:L-fucono-1,5-lactonase